MAFPLTHLLVAYELLTRLPRPDHDASLFLLGAIAPDAVHYRQEFISAEQATIGATKKISHLCPISDEKWGQVTDNDGWIECIKQFLRKHRDPMAEGYATHVLTDIYNNTTLWRGFSTLYPQEAAKGYKSGYYADLRNIDARLYQSIPHVGQIENLLRETTAHDMPRLVSAEEITAIRDSILNDESYKPPLPTPSREYTYVTYDEMLAFIQDAADFTAAILEAAP